MNFSLDPFLSQKMQWSGNDPVMAGWEPSVLTIRPSSIHTRIMKFALIIYSVKMDSPIWGVSYYSPRQMEESIFWRFNISAISGVAQRSKKISKPIFFHNSLKKFFFRNSLKKLFFLTVNCKKCFSKVYPCFLPLFLIWFWSITLKWLIFNIYFWNS